ncbi:uncharacterized protein [Coffea arabica]|uniref:Uncharacterized protein isoform X2 n=1 Tax=Coffea arabica TaxID=13443 RepID=A0ABM4VQ94_COFAR
MVLNDQVFVAWEERIISQEKGNRVVHYYLQQSSEDTVLAVVGTERSIRHMTYVVSKGFVDAYGFTGIVTAGTKWRARRDVVEWLTKLVSGFRLPVIVSKHQMIESRLRLRSPGYPMAGLHNLTNSMDQVQVSGKFRVQDSDIMWSGEAWNCSKELKHYQALCRKKTTIAVYSFVLIMAEEGNHYLGYLEDLYEDKKGEKMAQVRWFRHNQEVKQVIPELNAHPEEIFITPYVRRITAKCIDQVVTVLTPNHFEKCLALFPEKLSSRIYVCHREVKNNKIETFSLSNLRGYDNQAIVSSLNHHHDSMNKAKVHKPTEEENDFHSEDSTRQGTRRTRSRRRNHFGVTNLIPGKRMERCEPTHRKLKIKLSTKASINLVGAEPSQLSSEDDEKNIELLCQDSGIRGCWFRCKILQTSKKSLKVQYCDIQDVDGPGKLEEWVPASRVATPDELGMRFAGRHTVRPWPPHNSSDYSFEVGDAVDAWWSDGWWEAVIIGLDISGGDNVHVYSPGENKFLTLQRKDLRPSRDWVDNKWIEVKAKRDILSVIPSTVSCTLKLSMSTSTETSTHDSSRLPEAQVHVLSKLEASESGVKREHHSALSANQKDLDSLNLKKRLCNRHADDLVDKGFKAGNFNAHGMVKTVSEGVSGSQHKFVKK